MPSPAPNSSSSASRSSRSHSRGRISQFIDSATTRDASAALSESTLQPDAQDSHVTSDMPTIDSPNEGSPLLSPDASEHGTLLNGPPPDTLDGHADQQTKSTWYIILLTISIGGLQFAWSVELSNGSPYLLSLGLSKSLMALVWLAGPLSGTLVQPYIGMLSDNCRVPWGRRKPFMLGGTVATVISLLFLAWTKEIVDGLLGLFGADPKSEGLKITVIIVAVFWVYVLDFAINSVQAAIRAFIVDCAPAHQQEEANSMASRILGVGNIAGYCAGYFDLPKHLWWLGYTQFQILCSLASICLCATILISVISTPERDPRLDGPPAKSPPGVLSFFFTIFKSIRRLPPQIKKVCAVQFCAWIGFFPLLFYTSSYVGEIYAEPYLEQNPHMSPEELDRLYDKATRVGTFALLVFAIVSLVTNVLLPFFIAPTYNGPVISPATAESSATYQDRESQKKSLLDYLVIPGFTLRWAWLLSNLLFAGAMFFADIVRSVKAATFLIGLTGITWGLTLWAPWAIISAEISRRDATLRAWKQLRRSYPNRPDQAIDGAAETLVDHDEEGDEVDRAGIILGIHNMAIAAPQMLSTVGSSILFRIFQKPRGTPGDHSIGIVFACGGVFVLISAYFIYRIRDDLSPDPVGEEALLASAEQGEGETSSTAADTRATRRKSSSVSGTQDQSHLERTRSGSFVTGLEY